MGILSNLFLFNTLFNNAESSNAHDDDDLDIEIVEGEIEIETDDTDTLNDILEKIKQKTGRRRLRLQRCNTRTGI